jgi:hypothetical protein
VCDCAAVATFPPCILFCKPWAAGATACVRRKQQNRLLSLDQEQRTNGTGCVFKFCSMPTVS